MRLPSGQFFGSVDRHLDYQGLRFSSRHYESGDEQPWHTHERVTFFAHLAGDHIDEGMRAEWQLPPLGLIFHPASMVHRSRLGPTPVRGINLEFSDEWLAAHGLSRRELGDHQVCASDRVKASVLLMIRTYAPDPLCGQELSDMALELVESFLPDAETEERARPSWLARAETRILEAYREPIGLTQVAGDVDVHPMHLARVYRQRHGRSVTEQLQRLRIQAAVGQILAGDTISSAALDAGFADQFHFSRTLKAHYGFSPKLLKQIRPNLLPNVAIVHESLRSRR